MRPHNILESGHSTSHHRYLSRVCRTSDAYGRGGTRVVWICATLAAYIPEWCRRSSSHSREMHVRQRVFEIACGYEDQNDAATLRTDPFLKLVCGRFPDEADLASQPTLSAWTG